MSLSDWANNGWLKTSLDQISDLFEIAESYHPEKNLVYYRTIQSLPLILGLNKKNDADYLEACWISQQEQKRKGITT